MPGPSHRQCIGFCVVALLGIPAAHQASLAATAVPERIAGDFWEELFIQYLEALERFLQVEYLPPQEVEARVQAVSDWYHAAGIPTTGDRRSGLQAIRDTYHHLMTDAAGHLDPVVRDQFLADLRLMYSEAGGDPAELEGTDAQVLTP